MAQFNSFTLITDASLHCAGVGGWGAWAKPDLMPSRTWGGQITQKWVASSTEAELAAIALGLRAALDYVPGYTPLVQSDSWRALSLLVCQLGARDLRHDSGIPLREAGLQPTGDAEPRLLEMIWRLLGERLRDDVLRVRHVRGHRGKSVHAPGRNRVNEICDGLAKAHMRALRDSLGLAKPEPGCSQQVPT